MPLATANPRTSPTVNWPLVYLGIAVAGLGVILLKWLHVPPFEDISGLALATVIVGVFTGVSLIFWRTTCRNR